MELFLGHVIIIATQKLSINSFNGEKKTEKTLLIRLT